MLINLRTLSQKTPSTKVLTADQKFFFCCCCFPHFSAWHQTSCFPLLFIGALSSDFISPLTAHKLCVSLSFSSSTSLSLTVCLLCFRSSSFPLPVHLCCLSRVLMRRAHLIICQLPLMTWAGLGMGGGWWTQNTLQSVPFSEGILDSLLQACTVYFKGYVLLIPLLFRSRRGQQVLNKN